MATKSPGIYYTETDMTDYVNPSASVDTTVAVIGCAVKGPIGVPTEIVQFSDFKKIFGDPISGTLAGLAVRNILSSGGQVLFTRVADMSLATKSNVIIKNSTGAVPGKLIINNSNDISVTDENEYEISKVYGGTICDSKNNKKKIIIRSPNEGKLRRTEMLKQFREQLLENKAFVEYSVKDEIVQRSSVRSLKITKDEEVLNYYFDVTAGDINTTVRNINSAISNGVLCFSKFHLFASKFGETTYNSNAKNLNFRYYMGTSKDVLFTFKIVNNITYKATTVRATLSGTGDEKTGYYITISEMAEQLNKSALKEYCYVICGIDKRNFTDDKEQDFLVTLPYLNFIFKKQGEDYNFYLDEDTNQNSKSFVYIDLSAVDGPDSETDKAKIERIINEGRYKLKETSSSSDGSSDGSGDEEWVQIPDTFVFSSGETNRYSTSIGKSSDVTVTYNNKTKSIVFTTNGGIDSTVDVDPTSDPNFLFEDSEIFEAFSAELEKDKKGEEAEDLETLQILQDMNECSVGSFLGELEGQEGLSSVDEEGNPTGLQVAIENGQIVFFEENEINYGDFDTEPAWITTTEYLPLSKLIGKFTTDEVTEDEKCLFGKFGTPSVAANLRDSVVFTAREYGSGTKDIGIDIYSVTSSLDGTVTHNIDVYVNGSRKESFENVSYDAEYKYNPKSPTKDTDPIGYFADIINEEEENGGSAYIKVTVIKKDTSTTEVNLPDTSEITENKLIYLGAPLMATSVERTGKVAIDDYDDYDYSIGNDGVPSDTTDLFLDAMDTSSSGLSNKELYSWHILITPDNISEEVQDAAISLCEFMEDGMYIADPPQGLSRTGVVNWHNGRLGRSSAFTSNYAATYWPWCKVYDSSLKQYSWVPPSVVMAAQYCLVDKDRHPWYAPAGEQNGLLSSVIDIEEYPNKTDRDAMYLEQNRVNPFLKLRNGNIICYGEKTLQRKNSTLTKIHTRRMLIALKKELRSSIRGFIFLPTMTENISTIRSIATAIVERYKVGGGVSAYRVICDGSNNTSETLQQDILNLDVAVVPTGCIEQVNINFTLEKDEASL